MGEQLIAKIHPFDTNLIAKTRCRRDMHAAPILLVGSQVYRVDDRGAGANFNIEAAINMLERAPKNDIFEVLNVRDNNGISHETTMKTRYCALSLALIEFYLHPKCRRQSTYHRRMILARIAPRE
jgi:hypothetical protein